MSTVLVWGFALLAAAGIMAAPTLRRRWPRAWWYFVGDPVLWCRMRITWRRLAWQCDLAVSRRRRPTVVGGTEVKGRPLDVIVPRLAIGLPKDFGVIARV